MKKSCKKLIGNDIVDLTAAKLESNWRRKGYIPKIFSAGEQACIAASKDPDQLVWLFWSMKEAAYKIHSKCTGIRNYAPSLLQCELQQLSATQAQGRVQTEGACFYTTSSMDKNRIHTICAPLAEQLSQVSISISLIAEQPDFDYHNTKPECISHHGVYLALVYL